MWSFSIPMLLAALLFVQHGTAFAQESARRPFDWAGFYIGGNVGGAWGQASVDHTATGDFIGDPLVTGNLAAFGSGDLEPTAFLAGGQIGYNWLKGNWVVGLEADIQWWDHEASSSTDPQIYVPGATAAFRQSISSSYLHTLRLRAGTIVNDTLIYVTGGLAVSEFEFSQTVTFGPVASSASGSAKETKVGWTVGGGAEWAMSPNWTVKGEYLYVRFDGLSADLFNPSAPTFTHEARVDDLEAHVFRVGINYKH